MLTRLATAAVAVLLLAGCTQKSQSASTGPTSAPPSTPDSGSPVSVTPISSPIPFSPPPPSSSAPSSAPKPSVSPSTVIEPGGCPTSALTVRALRGSGAAGHEFAFVQFTNHTATSCSLTGYPGILLMLGGRPLGLPASRSGKPIQKVAIPPGASVSAGIVDSSSCNAPISDSVQVIPPNRTDKLVLKLAIRGCPLQVDPVSAN